MDLTPSKSTSRRAFLRRTAVVAGGAWALPTAQVITMNLSSAAATSGGLDDEQSFPGGGATGGQFPGGGATKGQFPGGRADRRSIRGR